MTYNNARNAPVAARSGRANRGLAVKLALVSAAALMIAGCKPGEEGPQVAGWSVVDPTQRHPILVSQQPSNLSMKVPRGSTGMSPHQRAQVVDFLNRYRGGDSGNSKLVIAAPSGSPNEVAAMQAVAEIRHLMRDSGFSESSITVEAYHEERDPQPAIRISYLRFVAEGPECGRWTTNLAEETKNLPYPNFGCATQRNFAAQVANPADLLGPRSMTPSAADRRDVVWGKYIKGESTISTKQADERSTVKGAN
ncbi:MAG: CpaD family pilus assembly protein [Hyphomicrobiaceae bacterium]